MRIMHNIFQSTTVLEVLYGSEYFTGGEIESY
jgi:hypothetical protein